MPAETSLLETPLDEEDSLRASRGTLSLSGRSSPTSSSARSSLRWEDRRGVDLEWARSQPGGLRRRRAGWTTGNGTFAAGDLDPWADAPLLEGASRRWGPATGDEAEAWRRGSGRLPNGLESEGRWDGLRLRSRWRDDRRTTENVHSAAMEVQWRGFHAGLRTEDPTGGKCATAGWRDMGWNLSGLALPTGLAGGRLRRETGPEGLSGEARWVSEAVRHGGIPAGWAGVAAASVAWRNPLGDPLLENVGLEAIHRDDLVRALVRGRWRPTWEPIRVSVGPSLGWSSLDEWNGRIQARAQRSDPRGWQPSLEAAWSDTAAGTGITLGVESAWSGNGRRTAVGVFGREDAPVQVFAEETGSVHFSGRSVELSLRLRSELATSPRIWGEGGIQCDW